jgi:hypothetical protein
MEAFRHISGCTQLSIKIHVYLDIMEDCLSKMFDICGKEGSSREKYAEEKCMRDVTWW